MEATTPPPVGGDGSANLQVSEIDLAYFAAMAEAARQATDRVRRSGEVLERSAAAIGTIYVGILAYLVGTSDGPAIGALAFAPAIFLAIAVCCGAAFATISGDAPDVTVDWPSEPRKRVVTHLNDILGVAAESSRANRKYLRAGLVALALGLATMPAPLLSLQYPAALPAAPHIPPRPATKDALGQIEYRYRLDYELERSKSAKGRPHGSEYDWTLVPILLGGCALIGVALRTGARSTDAART